jgi:hypothetical protein
MDQCGREGMGTIGEVNNAINFFIKKEIVI